MVGEVFQASRAGERGSLRAAYRKDWVFLMFRVQRTQVQQTRGRDVRLFSRS